MACICFEMPPDQLGNLLVTGQETGGCCDLNLQIMVQMGDSKPNPVNVKFSCEYIKRVIMPVFRLLYLHKTGKKAGGELYEIASQVNVSFVVCRNVCIDGDGACIGHCGRDFRA